VSVFLILKSYKVILCCSFNRDLIKIKHKYIYKDNKLLAPVFFFAELVKTNLWAICAEQYATYTRFLPRLARKEQNVQKLNSS